MSAHDDRATPSAMIGRVSKVPKINEGSAASADRPHSLRPAPLFGVLQRLISHPTDSAGPFSSLAQSRAHSQPSQVEHNNEARGSYRVSGPCRCLDRQDHQHAAHPIRFKGVAPKPPVLPTAAWINPPQKQPAQAPIKPSCSLN
jgi:putative transposase